MGLNKGKKSIAIDLRRPQGRELAQAIITAQGENAGIFVTNFPATGWLDFERLRRLRGDLIMVSIVGNPDGSTALDYTVNCATGFPLATGPADSSDPVNHALPAWDFICGQTAATAVLAADRHRRLTSQGQLIRIALSDVALAVVADLGAISEVQLNGAGRGRYGNHIYGAFGRDFATKEGRQVMVAAVSAGQWSALCKATGVQEALCRLERERGLDLTRDTDRFEAREAIASLLEPWFAARSLAEVRAELDAGRACWGVYQSFEQLVAEDARCSLSNALFAEVNHPGIGTTLTPRSPMSFSACEAVPALPGPVLGEHTEEVLRDVLGLGSAAVESLRERGVVAGPRSENGV